MLIEHENRYVALLREGFQQCEGLANLEEKTRIIRWLDDACTQRLESAVIEQVAGEILQAYPGFTGGDIKRYQFKATSQKNALIKLIFDKAFNKAREDDLTQPLIRAAEQASGNRHVFCPKWKKVLQVYVPRAAGNILQNPVFRVIAVVATIFATIVTMNASYARATDFTVRVLIPFAINHIPASCFRLYNHSTSLLKSLYNLSIGILLGCMLAKWAISKLGIPRVNRVLDRIDLFKIFNMLPSSSTFLDHALNSIWKAVLFTNTLCVTLGGRLENMAVAQEHRQLAYSREKAFEVWSTIIQNRLANV